MSRKTTATPDTLQEVINDIFEEYLNNVSNGIQDDVTEVGKTCKKLVKAYASSSGIKGSTYINSFKTKNEKGRYVTSVTIYSSKYQIAHLLENGHVIKYYGRPTGKMTRAFKHFAPAEEDAIELLDKKIKLTIESD